MSLLNALLGFGALAFSVPLMIHLLTRSRHQQIEWGAMHLLEKSLTQNQRRMRIEQFILLLIRCAIPVLLALAMARPVLTGWKALSGNTPRSLVVLLDNSYSMSTTDENGTRIDVARNTVRNLLDRLPSGSEASIIAVGGAALRLTDKPTTDMKTLKGRLTQLEVDCGPVNVASAIDEGMSELAAMKHAQRELVLISDFQTTDWKNLDTSVSARIAEQIRSLPIKPTIQLFSVSNARTQLANNLVVESITSSQRILVVDQPIEILIRLRSDRGDHDSLVMTPIIDGVSQPSQSLAMSGTSAIQVPWRGKFSEPGSHTLEISIDTRDGLMADNRRGLQLQIAPRAKVLLVDGDRRKGPLEGETDYLAIALAPFALGGLSVPDTYVTETITPNELNEKRMEGKQMVVLANVDRLNDAVERSVDEFVRKGGMVVVFLGARVQAEWYNKHLFGRYSIKLTERIGDPKVSDKATRILLEPLVHRGLEALNDANPEDVSKAAIRSWWRLELPDHTKPDVTTDTATNSMPSILARFTSHDPWWVEAEVGQGHLLVCSTTCDLEWTDLPVQPFYLPLIHDLFATGWAEVSNRQNLQTGEAIIEPLAESKRAELQALTWTTPMGVKQMGTTTVDEQAVRAEFHHTQRPGIYQLAVEGEPIRRYAVNAPASESNLTSLTFEEVQGFAEQMGARAVESEANYFATSQREQFGREIGFWFWVALLLFLFSELWWSQRMMRGSNA